ncbi:erg26, C-3 sterol dehydrogenase [Lecanora helva]
MAASSQSASLLTSPVLVIGGCGFLGHHIVSQLLAPSTCPVSVLDLKTAQNRLPNVTYHSADITSAPAVREVLQKVRPAVIIHTASPIASDGHTKGARQLFYKVNVEGTRTLLEQAAEIGCVKAFVYTSSASVIHDTVSDLVNADERWPVLSAPQQREYYSETKGIAEQSVLDANRKHGGMLTVALRPAGIFGEGDAQMIPGMLTAYKKGQTKFQLGDNENLFDFTYVGNVAHAHVLAAVALMETHKLGERNTTPLDTERVDGEAFFITNAQPLYFWDFARMVWSAAGDRTQPGEVWVIGKDVGLRLATLVEWVFWAVGKTPNLTRGKVQYSCLTRYYCVDKARARMGYVPLVGVKEGVERSVRWFLEREEGVGAEKKVQ